MSELFYSSIFGELVKNVQVRFDATSEMNKRLFDNVVFERFLKWDTPTIGLNFEEVIGQYNITVAAPTIGDQSKEAILGNEGVETLKEKVLNHAITIPLTIQEYRKIMQLRDSKAISEKEKVAQLVDVMFGNVKTAVDSVLSKIDMIFLNAISNEGRCVLDATNNPEGGVRGTINYNQPSGNIATSKTAWTEANIETIDVFADIQAILDEAQDKVVLAKILCDPAMITYICRSTKIRQLIHGKDKDARPVLLRDLNEFMQSNDLPVFEPIRRQIRIQNGAERTPYKPFNAKNLVFVPDGQLGVIKNAYANNELRQEPGVAYSNYGRIRVSQWGVGETQGSNGVEFTKAEAFALPVITEMNGIYTLKTQA
jgi:hypothetical protein